MKRKLYLAIVPGLEIIAFTNERQVKPAHKVVLVDEGEVENILNMRGKFAKQQLDLNELWKKADPVEKEKSI